MNLNQKYFRNIVGSFLFLLVFNCSNAQKVISGIISTEFGTPIENIVVSISGSLDAIVSTDENGYYEFTVAEGGNYTITPCYNADPLNGVSTFDKVLISNYLYSQGPLGSPYNRISADVDQNDSISASDTLVMQQLITQTITSFPNSKSWRFIEASFIFPDPFNPFSSAFPEEGIADDLTNDTTISFIGLKIGDVNYSSINQLSISLDDLSNGCVFDIVNNDFIIENHVEIKAFPNPFGNNFTVNLGKEYGQTDIEIYTSSGIKITNNVYYNTENITVDLPNELTGIYFVKIIIADGAKWISMIKA